MSEPFIVNDEGALLISEATIMESQIICSGVGLGLPEDFGKEAKKQEELLERRLSRIELALGLGPLEAVSTESDSEAELIAALSSFSSTVQLPDS
jgi:hypothetical protein